MNTFEEHSDSGLYWLKYHLIDHMVEDVRKSGTLSVFNSSLYQYSNVHTKRTHKRTSQRR